MTGRMKVFRYLALYIVFGIVVCPSDILEVKAHHESGLNFSIKAILPENQLNRTVGYFDLRMKPNQTQTLQVLMENATDRELTVKVYPTAAVTNNAGEIDYTQKETVYDDSLAFPFPELISVEETVAVPPRSSYTLDIIVRMPEERFDGMILGGLYFIEKEAQNTEGTAGELQIKNRFSYTIGVRLTETDTVVSPDITFRRAYASQVNYRNCVKVCLQNSTAAVMKGLKIDAAIYAENGSDILHKQSREGLKMAPNSSFDYGVGWEGRRFEAGTYRLEVKAESGDARWEWTEYFKIEKEEAERLNSEAVELENSGDKFLLWNILAAVGISLLVIIILIFIIRKQRKIKEK